MWTEDWSNGKRERGMFAEGKKTGPWRSIRKDGIRWETTFQDGVMNHTWRPVCTEQPSSARSALNSFSSPQSGTLLQQTQFRRPSPRKPSETPPCTGGVPQPPPSPRSQSSSTCAVPPQTLWHGRVNGNGDRHGRGVLIWDVDNRCEGECVNGVEQGKWVFKNVRGAELEGCLVDGKKSGRWTETYSNGDQAEGFFAEGKKTGIWKLRMTDGTLWEKTFQDGEMDDDWQVRATGGRGASQSLGPLQTSSGYHRKSITSIGFLLHLPLSELCLFATRARSLELFCQLCNKDPFKHLIPIFPLNI